MTSTTKPAIRRNVGKPSAAAKPARAKEWRSTLGMFSGDALMKEIDEEGRRIREAETKAQDIAGS